MIIGRGLNLFAFSLFFILVFSTAFIHQVTANEILELRLSYPMPQNGFHGQGYTFFAKAVEEESNGEIKIKTFPGRSLLDDPDALDAVMRGNVDIVNFMVAYVSPIIKELIPLEIPGAYPGDRFKEFEAATRPVFEKIFSKYGVKYLGINDQDTICFAASKKVGRPIRSPSDLKGLTVRTPGKWGGESIKLWGGSPVTASLGDISSALDRGTIKVSYTGWIITGPFRLYEPAPFVTMTDLQEMLCGLLMSNKAWNRLNINQQAAIQRAAYRWMDFSNKLSGDLKKKFEEEVKQSGGTVYHLTDEENDAFKKITKPLLKKVEKLCGSGGKELLQIIENLREE